MAVEEASILVYDDNETKPMPKQVILLSPNSLPTSRITLCATEEAAEMGQEVALELNCGR